MELVIEARGISRQVGSLKALNEIRFEVAKGRCLAICGATGSGKTTLMRLLAGILPPTSGELFVLDLNARDSGSVIRSRVGLMPDRDGFNPELTVLDTLLTHGSLYGLGKAKLMAKARELLRWFQLDEFENWPVFELKRTQIRRLALARALVTEPEVLLVDGIGRDLSPSDRCEIIAQLKELKNRGLSIVLSSRDLDEVEHLCDHVIILDRGRIVCQGAPEALIRDHIGRDVVEYDVLAADLDYHLQAVDGKFQYQVLPDRLKIFVPESVDTVTALRWVPSEKVVYRRARLHDVYAKMMGHESPAAERR